MGASIFMSSSLDELELQYNKIKGRKEFSREEGFDFFQMFIEVLQHENSEEAKVLIRRIVRSRAIQRLYWPELIMPDPSLLNTKFKRSSFISIWARLIPILGHKDCNCVKRNEPCTEFECPICLSSGNARQTHCNHIFCSECLYQLVVITQKRNCPLCRSIL